MNLGASINEKAALIWAIAYKLTGVEDAGQHYTPREVIRLMVNILFCDDNSTLSGKNIVRTIYDEAVV